MTLFVQSCTCKALMRPRWSRDEPRVFVCTRCGKPVPGYEQLWVMRERMIAQEKKR